MNTRIKARWLVLAFLIAAAIAGETGAGYTEHPHYSHAYYCERAAC